MIKVAIPITGNKEFKALKKLVLVENLLVEITLKFLKKIMLNLLVQNML